MAIPPNPPLRVREVDGSPNVIPVLDIQVTNGDLTNLGGGRIRIATSSANTAGAHTLDSSTHTDVRAITEASGQFLMYDGGSWTALNVGSSGQAVISRGGVLLPIWADTGSGVGAHALDSTSHTDVQSITETTGQLLLWRGSSWGAFGPGSEGQVIVYHGNALPTMVDSAGLGLFTSPIQTGTGGTGLTSPTAFGLLSGSGASALVSVATMLAGQLLVGSGPNRHPIVIASGGAGTFLIQSAGAVGALAWVGSGSITHSGLTGLAADDHLQYTLTSRTITTLFPLTGGANLSADRTLSADTAFLVTSSRTISTTSPVAGGGNLGADRTLTVDTLALVTSGRTISAGTGLTGGGDLSADRTFSVNTNIREKAFVFFAAGTLANTMFAGSSRIYIPYSMELLRVQLAMVDSPVGQAVIVDVNQYNNVLGASTSVFASANRPQVAASANVGSSLTFAIGNLYAGSYLGFDLDQIGTTTTGGNLTIGVYTRTS